MITIRLIQDTLIEGQHVIAGGTVSVNDPLARFLIGINKAVVVADEPVIETATIPNELERAVQKRKRKSEDKMNLKTFEPPLGHVLPLDRAKEHLRVDVDVDDDLIDTYLGAATQICEETARRAFAIRTYDLYLNDWWGCNGVKLPMPPMQSVVAITYTTSNGIELTLDSSDYIADTASEPGRVVWATGKSAPTVALKPVNGIKIRYEAGYFNVPEMYLAAVLLVVGHLYENRENVGFQTAYKLPMGAESILLMDRGYR